MENIQQQLKEKFFTKKLSAEERALFVEQMATDKAFAEDIAIELQLRKTLIAQKQWIPDFDNTEKKNDETSIKITPKRVFLPYYYAAAAATLIGISILVLDKYSQYKEKQDLIALNQKAKELEALKKKQAQAIRDSLAAVALADSLQKDIVKINTSILDIAQSLYSQTAGSSEPKPKKKWLAAFKELEKKQFANVNVVEINDILKEAQPEFDNAKKEDVSQNDLFKFVLLNMLVKPRSTQQEKNLQKWLINFQHKQLNVEQEKYWNQMRQAY